MIIPVRCFSCGRVIASDYIKFVEESKRIRNETGHEPTGAEKSEILDNLGIERYCCRRMILSNADLIDEIISY
ncbi:MULTISPECIES: DNA-directed RNA polymerase subunit N [Acidiplasma]|jgi:DNA-directed RNA polymerase subunit N|uniref:DNA-directed RNA polymerase subunit Rpo10 n=2 Tax=Acidiplasma TaxID=507753 RepID=A0A0Q0WKR0_9ARCH|nr:MULTISPECIES: DNA-directed RNA polymerase subunit N [Acidiplasma]KJE49568.1 DNA-directed RNA polymerase subunit N [Acidiplasma sp. MBA-1]KPV44970.1 DNA-directed RNA polymerase subunit N [Acidiplasma aeolicum]KQB34060.1 DNA-directed RNA polymerase subunit N [Acidiplasma aeolicum]KQB36318.1 DNA-directed RNA polymerase subunit N [Acidiplasma cupricumulans]WMT54160.1 MAG: DNA-directed RNA polymerase subunit N [Acidiplasma sp.]